MRQVAVARLDQQAGIEDRPRQFLDEQRHAFGVGKDLVGDFGWQLLSACHSLHDRCARRPGSSRPSGSTATCDSSFQRGSNSGRAVTTSRAGRSASRSTSISSHSAVVGSIQWASSTSTEHRIVRRRRLDQPRQGRERARPDRRRRQSRRLDSARPHRSTAASPAAAASRRSPSALPSSASSLSSLLSALSSPTNPAARSSCAMTGWSALLT